MKNDPRKRGPDRRVDDVGPATGWRERRRNPERRMPEVAEGSLEEFESLVAGLEAGHSAVHGWDKLKKIE